MKAGRLVDQFAELPFGDSRRSQKFCKSEENFDKNRWPEWEPYDETLVQVISVQNSNSIKLVIFTSKWLKDDTVSLVPFLNYAFVKSHFRTSLSPLR